MSYQLIHWAALAPGDSVRLRPMRVPGSRVETSVVRLLERAGTDSGIVDDAGDAYRQFYYDVEIFTSPAIMS